MSDLGIYLITSHAKWIKLLRNLESPETLPEKLTCRYTGNEEMVVLVKEYNEIPKEDPRKFEIAQEILSEVDYEVNFN